MMIVCPACGEEIEFVSIKKNSGFTLGNIKNGKFRGNRTLYYHKDCLLTNDILK